MLCTEAAWAGGFAPRQPAGGFGHRPRQPSGGFALRTEAAYRLQHLRRTSLFAVNYTIFTHGVTLCSPLRHPARPLYYLSALSHTESRVQEHGPRTTCTCSSLEAACGATAACADEEASRRLRMSRRPEACRRLHSRQPAAPPQRAPRSRKHRGRLVL